MVGFGYGPLPSGSADPIITPCSLQKVSWGWNILEQLLKEIVVKSMWWYILIYYILLLYIIYCDDQWWLSIILTNRIVGHHFSTRSLGQLVAAPPMSAPCFQWAPCVELGGLQVDSMTQHGLKRFNCTLSCSDMISTIVKLNVQCT